MYADAHARSSRLDPKSLVAAIAINAAVLAALLTAAPDVLPDRVRSAIDIVNIPLIEPTPPPPEPQPETETRTTPAPQPLPKRIDPIVIVPLPNPGPTTERHPVIDVPPLPTPLAPPSPLPLPSPRAAVIIDAAPAPGALGAFQPVYPASERRAGAEGFVRVAVTIGADGRVRAVERLEATSDAFWRATERQALTRWRFRPATRDGVAVESRKIMTVRFTLES